MRLGRGLIHVRLKSLIADRQVRRTLSSAAELQNWIRLSWPRSDSQVTLIDACERAFLVFFISLTMSMTLRGHMKSAAEKTRALGFGPRLLQCPTPLFFYYSVGKRGRWAYVHMFIDIR